MKFKVFGNGRFYNFFWMFINVLKILEDIIDCMKVCIEFILGKLDIWN